MKKVKDYMTKEVETCSLLDNVYEAAVKMKENNCGAIPIVDGKRLVGIITDRDIVIRGIAEKRPPSLKIDGIMTKEVITISEDDSIYTAAKLMAEHQIRRLPVVKNGELVGIIALGDIAKESRIDYQAKMALSEISVPKDEEKRPN